MYPGLKIKLSHGELGSFGNVTMYMLRINKANSDRIHQIATNDVLSELFFNIKRKHMIHKKDYSFSFKPLEVWFLKYTLRSITNQLHPETLEYNVYLKLTNAIDKYRVNTIDLQINH